MRNKGSGFSGSDRNLKPVTSKNLTSDFRLLSSDLCFFCFSFDVERSIRLRNAMPRHVFDVHLFSLISCPCPLTSDLCPFPLSLNPLILLSDF